MIGGYIYAAGNNGIEERLKNLLAPDCGRIDFCDNGFLFYTNPFRSDQKPYASSDDLIALSEDLIVGQDGSGMYRRASLDPDFLNEFEFHGPEAFDSIQSDFRMAVALNRDSGKYLFLASHRAGSGRMYYHLPGGGILFCSDLRFLLKLVPFEVSLKALYAMLKYGSIPEPLTIGERIFAVPPAHYLKMNIVDGEASAAPYFKYRFPADRSRAAFEEESSLGAVEDVLRRTAKFIGNSPSSMLLSGGIDSSLYGCYLNLERTAPVQAFYCSFGSDDPEYPYARAIAERLGVELQTATMGKSDALQALDDVVRLSDHPFSDFSSLPIVFLLQYIRDRQQPGSLIVECNGADDCFGFRALTHGKKFAFKHFFPAGLKSAIVRILAESSYWKWASSEGALARIAAMADVHEKSVLDYFLVQVPVNYLKMNKSTAWDNELHEIIEKNASSLGQDYDLLSYEAKTTIRQLLYVNSSRWAAKAFSVGESLKVRVIYPYIWRDVLLEQGKLPWDAKVRGGTVKWPLKRLLEQYMPADFIYRRKSGFVPPLVRWLTDSHFNDKVRDILLGNKSFVSEIIPARTLEELLMDARSGRDLRSSILNMLWSVIFVEAWIQARRAESP